MLRLASFVPMKGSIEKDSKSLLNINKYRGTLTAIPKEKGERKGEIQPFREI